MKDEDIVVVRRGLFFWRGAHPPGALATTGARSGPPEQEETFRFGPIFNPLRATGARSARALETWKDFKISNDTSLSTGATGVSYFYLTLGRWVSRAFNDCRAGPAAFQLPVPLG